MFIVAEKTTYMKKNGTTDPPGFRETWDVSKINQKTVIHQRKLSTNQLFHTIPTYVPQIHFMKISTSKRLSYLSYNTALIDRGYQPFSKTPAVPKQLALGHRRWETAMGFRWISGTWNLIIWYSEYLWRCPTRKLKIWKNLWDILWQGAGSILRMRYTHFLHDISVFK